MDSPKTYGTLNPCGGGDPIPLLNRRLIVGRRSSCDVTLRFPNISSHHCELELINGYWHVRDLGSSNGIRVNSEHCDSKWIFPGDVLHVARHKFEVRYEAVGERPVEDEDPFARSLLEKAGLVQTQRQPNPVPEIPDQPGNQEDEDLAREWLESR